MKYRKLAEDALDLAKKTLIELELERGRNKKRVYSRALANLLEEDMRRDAVEYGKIIQGRRKPRVDALKKVMLKTISKIPNGTWKEHLAALEEYDDCHDELGINLTIQCIDWEAEIIYWIDRRGNEKETRFKAFRDRRTKCIQLLNSQVDNFPV